MTPKELQRLQKLVASNADKPAVEADAEWIDIGQEQANEVAAKFNLPTPMAIGRGRYCCGFVRRTTAQALQLLEHNIANNRNEVKGHIEGMRRHYASAFWQPTHQGIAINGKGQMFDGQNRLDSQIQENATASHLIWIYEPGDGLLVLDTVRSRSAFDHLTITEHHEVTKGAIEVTKMLLAIYGKLHNPNTDEVLSFFTEISEPVSWSIAHLESKTPGVKRAAVRAAVAVASLHVNRARLAEFCKLLTAKELDAAPGRPEETVASLRAMLADKSKRSTGAGGRGDNFGFTQDAIQHYLAGRAHTNLAAHKDPLFELTCNC